MQTADGSDVRRAGDFLSDALHIFILCSFAIAQPLFDLLAQYAEFFAVRRSEPVDVLLLVVICSIGWWPVVIEDESEVCHNT